MLAMSWQVSQRTGGTWSTAPLSVVVVVLSIASDPWPENVQYASMLGALSPVASTYCGPCRPDELWWQEMHALWHFWQTAIAASANVRGVLSDDEVLKSYWLFA